MAYKVKLTVPAENDLYAAFGRIREAAPISAEKWLRGFFAALQTREEMPARCPLISEAEELGHLTRELLYGKRTNVYRIIFDVQEQSEEGQIVRVLRVWHGSRDAIDAADIDTGP